MAQKATVPFTGTKEQEGELLKVIAELKDTKGALMPIMQKAQDIYGYLPIEVQKIISDNTGIPLEKIYGVATFYAQFALQPKGKFRISVCMLRKRLRKDLRETSGSSEPERRRMHTGRQVFSGILPLCRRMWSCTGYDDQ